MAISGGTKNVEEDFITTFVLEDFAIYDHEQVSETGSLYWQKVIGNGQRAFDGDLGSSMQNMCKSGFLQGGNLTSKPSSTRWQSSLNIVRKL